MSTGGRRMIDDWSRFQGLGRAYPALPPVLRFFILELCLICFQNNNNLSPTYQNIYINV
jgi:hypothetical protein